MWPEAAEATGAEEEAAAGDGAGVTSVGEETAASRERAAEDANVTRSGRAAEDADVMKSGKSAEDVNRMKRGKAMREATGMSSTTFSGRAEAPPGGRRAETMPMRKAARAVTTLEDAGVRKRGRAVEDATARKAVTTLGDRAVRKAVTTAENVTARKSAMAAGNVREARSGQPMGDSNVRAAGSGRAAEAKKATMTAAEASTARKGVRPGCGM